MFGWVDIKNIFLKKKLFLYIYIKKIITKAMFGSVIVVTFCVEMYQNDVFLFLKDYF
jgi:hypothetical protein